MTSPKGLSVFVNIGAKLLPSFSGTVRAGENRLKGMTRSLKLFGAELKAEMLGIEGLMSGRRARFFEGVGAAYLGYRAIQPFVDFEDGLVRMGNTAQIYGPRLDAIGKDVQQIGQQFGYAGTDAIAGANDFVAAGLRMDQAIASLAPTLMLAKTAGVEVNEASQAGIALMQNLGLQARDLGAAFDVMAKAGKEGRFEINDMARAFPGLSSRAKLLGMTGIDGVRRMSAMLQITRMNARDAEEAENNLLNFFDKLTGNETQQHFSKMGVSIERVWKRATLKGTDFVDEMLSEIGRLTKGGTDAFALTKLFPDRQARQAALALLQNRGEERRIYGATGQSTGTLAGDFGRISKTSKFGLDRFWAGLNRIGVALGKAFGPMLGEAAEKFAVFAERFAAWAEKNPAVVNTIGSLVAGFVGLRTALAGLGLVFGGRTMLLFRMLGGAGFRGLGRGLVSLIGPNVLAGVRRFGPMVLRELGGSLLRGLGGLALRLLPLLVGLFTPPGLAIMVGAAAVALIYYFWDDIKAAWPAVKQWFVDAFDGIVAFVKSIDWRGVGLAIADSLTFGLASKINPSTWGAIIKGATTGMAAGGAGGAVVGGAAAAIGAELGKGAAGKRALGGPVRAGLAYEVGERGREVFVPRTPGTIIPNGRRAIGGGGGVHVGEMHFHECSNPQAVAAAVDARLRQIARGQNAYLND